MIMKILSRSGRTSRATISFYGKGQTFLVTSTNIEKTRKPTSPKRRETISGRAYAERGRRRGGASD